MFRQWLATGCHQEPALEDAAAFDQQLHVGVGREAFVAGPAQLAEADRTVPVQPGRPAEPGYAVLEDARPQRQQLH
jgi:hypothetical protein